MAHKVYLPASDGPFRCDHCVHYGPVNRCSEPHIVKLLGPVERGLAKVDPGGCSDYFERRMHLSGATMGQFQARFA